MARSIEREMPGLHCDGEVDLRGLQQAIELQHRLGAIDFKLKAADIVDSRFVMTRDVSNPAAAVESR
jgi:hypothetical protein